MGTANADRIETAKAEFGAELRRLRKNANLSQQALARQVGYSRVYVTLVETGRDIPGEEFVRLISDALDTTGQLERRFTELQRARDAERNKVLFFPASSPGADTHELAGDLNDAITLEAVGPEGETLVVKITRRTALKQLGATAAIASVVSPLAASPGGRDLTPIEHLVEMQRKLIDSDNLFGSSYALQGTHDQLRIVEHLCQSTLGADRHQLLVLRAQFAESMAWLTQDQADHGAAHRWTDRALEWSHVAGDPTQTAIVLARKSQLAADLGQGAAALDYAMALSAQAQPATRLPALAEVCAAHGYALLNQPDDSARAYDRARELIDATDLDPEADWGAWLDTAYIDAQQARSLSVLGHHDSSDHLFTTALEQISETYPRDRGVYLARAARAVAKAGETDRAAELGRQALDTGQALKSGRIDTELRSLLREFDSTNTESVNDFRELARLANVA